MKMVKNRIIQLNKDRYLYFDNFRFNGQIKLKTEIKGIYTGHYWWCELVGTGIEIKIFLQDLIQLAKEEF